MRRDDILLNGLYSKVCNREVVNEDLKGIFNTAKEKMSSFFNNDKPENTELKKILNQINELKLILITNGYEPREFLNFDKIKTLTNSSNVSNSSEQEIAKPKESSTKDIRTIEDASLETGISQEKILNAAQNGEIEAAKVGNDWRFGQRAIDEIKSKLSSEKTPPSTIKPNIPSKRYYVPPPKVDLDQWAKEQEQKNQREKPEYHVPDYLKNLKTNRMNKIQIMDFLDLDLEEFKFLEKYLPFEKGTIDASNLEGKNYLTIIDLLNQRKKELETKKPAATKKPTVPKKPAKNK